MTDKEISLLLENFAKGNKQLENTLQVIVSYSDEISKLNNNMENLEGLILKNNRFPNITLEEGIKDFSGAIKSIKNNNISFSKDIQNEIKGINSRINQLQSDQKAILFNINNKINKIEEMINDYLSLPHIEGLDDVITNLGESQQVEEENEEVEISVDSLPDDYLPF